MSRATRTTRIVRSGIGSDQQHGAVIPPISLSSTFTFEGFDRPREYDYTRTANPTRGSLEHALASAESGARAVVTSSGMAAVHLVLQTLSADDLLVAPHDAYGGTHRLITTLADKGHFRLELVDLTAPDVVPRLDELCPAMVWIETPSNPLLRLTDIARLSELGRKHGFVTVVDNTFLSPHLQQPLTLGADIVVHSTTKSINGHSDVVGGAAIARSEEIGDELAWWANALGCSGSPFDAFLTQRGLRTLAARWAAHEANARTVVDRLCRAPEVRKVYHPSIPEHPGHALACRQQTGFGSIVSFELEGGVESVRAFVEQLSHISLAESLGGVESLIAHPATMTHAAMPPEARRRAGICDSLLRLSVGIEDVGDLIADLDEALARAAQASRAKERTPWLESLSTRKRPHPAEVPIDGVIQG